MKKLFLFITVILFLSACSQDIKKESLRVGFCPTMQEDAMSLKSKNESIKLVRFSSAGEVLENLKLQNIDAGLIGRKANKKEITENIAEKKIQEGGYTLVTLQKQAILENDLRNLQINTCCSEKVKELYPKLNLNFKNCDYKNGQPWLISWNDFSEELELLIPVNKRGEKIKKFRTPYFHTSLSLNNFNF